ncbi:hypothetical protein HR45_01275 [Shewanella mangrovi]|uniref:Uncharacterized protein n=1 Tax=Shewanella mangrovi TaxID=1515746 RepID=A0A094LUZ1_9GAMM|nr:hypothetical protein [Shewanella mangrovi]KFZ39058.1 hypothetical protein HR45_01275 [Shewanella mangrovi]
MLFLGFAVLTWTSRNAHYSEARQAICLSIALAMLCMALLGILEYLRGFAGFGIALAVVTEAIIAYGYFKLWRDGQQTDNTMSSYASSHAQKEN